MAAVRKKDEDVLAALFAEALDAALGPAVVLDKDLKVRVVSPSAEEALGTPIPLGASAPALLCGDRPKRPIAEALIAGRPVQALIPRVDQATGLAGDTMVRVRSVPLRHEGASSPPGWLLLMEAAAGGAEPELFHGMWTRDPRMKTLFRTIEKVARDDVPVLVRGDTGAGKELVAASVHAESPRRAGPYRALNCAALPANLLESELFGHARGAFTGAVKDMPGHMQLAHKGTLFLDEIAEIPLELQAKLLRVLETGLVLPVGAREPIATDVRIVSATHRSLRKDVEAGRFRGDLMYRLRVIPLFLPPLRERRGDISLLVEKFIAQMNPTKRRAIDRVSPAAMRALERHDWPGNVRELRNVLAYAYAIGDGDVLELSHLPPELVIAEMGPEIGPDLAQTVTLDAETYARAPALEPEDHERRRITDALERANQSRERAAKLLGWSRVTLWRRMRELGFPAAR